MNEKHQKKNHTCLSVRRPFICFFLALGVFLLSAFPTELYAQKKKQLLWTIKSWD